MVANMKRLLKLPEHIVPIALVSVGYPAEQKPQPERYQADRVHHDRW